MSAYTTPGTASITNMSSVESTPLISRVLRHDDNDAQENWNQKATKKTLDFIERNTGLLLITVSQSFFASMNVAVKKLNNLDPPVSPMQLIAVRMGITFICSMTYMIAAGTPDPIFGPSGVRLKLLFRGFSGFTGLFGIYFSLQYLSLCDATVLTFLAPICTVFTGAIFLGESFSRRQIIAATVSFSGVVLIARPTFLFGSRADLQYPSNDNNLILPSLSQEATAAERVIAVGVALVGVCGTTGAYTVLRAIGRKAHALHAMTAFSGISVINASIGLFVMRTPVVIPTRLEGLVLFALIGIFGFVAQFLLTKGFQYEKAGKGSMAVYTQIVFASVMERIFFHTVPNSYSVIGTILILGSAFSVALTKETQTPPPRLMLKDDAESCRTGEAS